MCASLTLVPSARVGRACNWCRESFTGKARKYCSLSCKATATTAHRLAQVGDLVPREKECSICGLTRPAHMFKIVVSRKDGLSTACRECLTGKAKAYRDQPGNRDRVRERNLLRKYGLTLADYEMMLAFQNGRCSICGVRPKGSQKRLSVDHDHHSGAIRSLACRQCNQYKIGNLTQDEVEMLCRYFRNPPADAALGERRYVPKGMEEPRKRRSPRKRRRSG